MLFSRVVPVALKGGSRVFASVPSVTFRGQTMHGVRQMSFAAALAETTAVDSTVGPEDLVQLISQCVGARMLGAIGEFDRITATALH